jgi:hypothetical protein
MHTKQIYGRLALMNGLFGAILMNGLGWQRGSFAKVFCQQVCGEVLRRHYLCAFSIASA